jgi:hypothetical protein
MNKNTKKNDVPTVQKQIGHFCSIKLDFKLAKNIMFFVLLTESKQPSIFTDIPYVLNFTAREIT